MADVIATIWDFDKTLIDGYMQEPLFREYKVEPKVFWGECNQLIEDYKKNGYQVNADVFYLNLILRYVSQGRFKGLNNEKLKSYGASQKFYPGAVDLLREIKELNNVQEYKEFEIQFENYIVSTGLCRIIEGSEIFDYVEKVWGCEFLENESKDSISEVGYTLDNTTKTRAIFEINKGVGIGQYRETDIDVNTKIPESDRRVQFFNMIYVADGPSDVPSFSLVDQKGGATFAVYPKGDEKALKQVDEMRRDGRVQMYAEADYQQGSTAYLWIINKIKSQAQAIIKSKREALSKYHSGTPKHML